MGITPFSQPGSTGRFRLNRAYKHFKRAQGIKILLNIPANDPLSTGFLDLFFVPSRFRAFVIAFELLGFPAVCGHLFFLSSRATHSM
jgi:hypothetical protein